MQRDPVRRTRRRITYLIRKMLQLFRHSGMDRRKPDCRDAPKTRAVHGA